MFCIETFRYIILLIYSSRSFIFVTILLLVIRRGVVLGLISIHFVYIFNKIHILFVINVLRILLHDSVQVY